MPRKNYNQWVHMRFFSIADSGNQTTQCGKTARRITASWERDRVTCPRCREILEREPVSG